MQGEVEPLGFVQLGEEKAKEGLYIPHLYTKCVVTVEIEPKDKGMDSWRIKSSIYRSQQQLQVAANKVVVRRSLSYRSLEAEHASGKRHQSCLYCSGHL